MPASHNKPFSSGGYTNSNGMFANYAADDYIPKPKKKNRDRRRPQSSRPSHRYSNRPEAPTCDRNGCPTSTHRGRTSIRHRSHNGAWPGTCVPHNTRRMDHSKEFGWMPDPQTDNDKKTCYRESYPEKRMTKASFRPGGKKDLFDPTTRVHATNHTAAPDKRLMDWAAPHRAKHPRPWAVGHDPLENKNDRGFIGGHAHFPSGQPYHDYEAQQNQTQLMNKRGGYRHDARTSSTAVPWKRSTEHNPLKGTDRADRLHAVRAENQMDYHNGAGANSQVWIR